MAQGSATREQPIVAQWDLPVKGVIRGIKDLNIPQDALFESSNAELLEGSVRGRSGLTAFTAQLFGATPMAALNFWQSGTAGWIVLATTSSIWTYEIGTATWTNRGGSLTGTIDNPIRIVQFEFGGINRVYIVNGVDAPKTWKPGDATVTSLANLGPEKVTDGDFATAGSWIYGTGWAHDSTNKEADHTAGNTAALEQIVGAVAGEQYRVVFTVKNRTAGTITPEVGGVAGTAVSSNATFSQDITATGTGNLKLTPSSGFDGSIDDVSVKKIISSAPIFKDIAVAADRLVGSVATHELRWGEPLTDSDFPAANSRLFTETPSPIVAVRNLGVLGLVVYKQDSIWGGDVTGLAGASAFRFNMVEQVEGPAGPNAVEDADGVHIYVTKRGRIGIFNGFIRKWICDGVWKTIKDEIDQTKPNRIHVVYIPDLFQARIYYKRTGNADTDGLLIVNLERKDLGIPWSAWPGRMGKSITAGCTVLDDSFTSQALVFSNNAGAEKAYTVTGTTDDGVVISSHMQSGLTLPAKLEVARALSLEAFVERLAGYGNITAKLVFSNILDKIEGTLSSGSLIDLTAVPIKNPIGFDTRGRFLGLRLEWTSSATVRYRGAVLRGAEIA